MTKTTIIRIATQVHGRILVRAATKSSESSESSESEKLVKAREKSMAAPLLVAFHGYGENAEHFLEVVCEIPGTSAWHVVAIQALHPFYVRKTGDVGATWMTSQDRDLAISDNIAYVTRAIDEIKEHLALEQPSEPSESAEAVAPFAPTVFLGFSQGTAMAYRAAWFSNRKCDGLIALAGDAPSEVEDASRAESVQTIPRVLIGRGVNDTWYDGHKLERDVARVTAMGSSVETCVFDGGHEWTDVFRSAASVFLKNLAGSNP